MLRTFSKTISILLHPIFIPLYSLFVLFHLPIYLNYKYAEGYYFYVYAMIFVNLTLAPALITFYLKRKGHIKSMEMEDVKDRVIPYIISCIFYLLTWILLKKIKFPSIYLEIFQWAGVTVFLLLILSFFREKASAHMAALGGLCGMLIAIGPIFGIDSSNLLIIVFLLSGLLGFARFYLNAHKGIELITGFLLGLSMQLYLLL